MTSLDRLLDLLADERIAGLLFRRGPALAFASDGTPRFANPAGAAVLGAQTLADLSGGRARVPDALAREVERLARSLPHGGEVRLERLRLPGALVPSTLACRRLFVLREAWIALASLDDGGDRPASLSQVASYLAAGLDGAVLVCEAEGRVLARSAGAEPVAALADILPDAAARSAAAGPVTTHVHDGRRVSLHRVGPGLLLAELVPAPLDQPAIAPTMPEPAQAAPEGQAETGPGAPSEPAPPEVAAIASPPESHGAAPSTGAALARPRRLPMRFVWQTDPEGHLAQISSELAEAVGPLSADVVGEKLVHLAERLGFDPDGRIARAMTKRDTWSGVGVGWPTDDGSQALIDLAGLPVFDRARSFQGYRGFGVCRAVVPGPVRTSEPTPAIETEPADRHDPDVDGAEDPAPDNGAVEAGPTPATSDEPVKPPALTTAPPNVVPLRASIDVRRIGLSTGERAAFREIGRALGGDTDAATALRIESPPERPLAAEAPSVPSAFAIASPAVLGETRQDDERSHGLELALRRLEAETHELRAILEAAGDGVVLLDRDGRILGANAAVESAFGYPEGELAGRGFAMLFSADSHLAVADLVDRAGRGAGPAREGCEVTGRRRDGGLIALFVTVGRLAADGGRLCAVLRDISPWKRTEDELLAARRAAERASSHKSDFLAKISHEIRTPLNAIIGFSEVMMEERFGQVGNPRYKEYLQDIHISGTHVVSLVNDLLDLSKIEAGRLDLTFTRVDLNAVLTECMAIMQPQANRERIIIRSSLAPSLPAVVADARSIRQIALNLLSNSIKFTRPGGQVILSTALSELGEIVMRVRDTGIGMTEAEISAALEPFRQIATSSRASDGTGLGLPLTKALVEANRAGFSIKSAVNAGTMVEITFPPARVLAE